jgi:hypothetical protein
MAAPSDGRSISHTQLLRRPQSGRCQNRPSWYQESIKICQTADLIVASHNSTTHNDPMWWTGVAAATAAGFTGFKTVAELRDSSLREVPHLPGVYLILTTEECQPEFKEISAGGHFKGRNPTVPPQLLAAKWIDKTSVLYVGKAGGNRSSNLRARLKQYLRFGGGAPVGHWGGRYIWQLAGCESLLVCWKSIEGQDPLEVERRMLHEFSAALGSLPFANCRR